MPEVKDKKFPYTKEGMKAARAYAKKTGAKTEKAPAVLIPFNPRVHKPIQMPDGSIMTERTATEYVDGNSGQVWNIPTIWFDANTNKGVEVDLDRAMGLAHEYEQRTGNKFPRFNSIEDAVSSAQQRSESGGATQGSLAKTEKTFIKRMAMKKAKS